MKRFKLFSALLLLLCMTLSLTACSSASFDVGAASGNMAPQMPRPSGSSMEMDPADGFLDENYSQSLGNGSYYENTKVILTADLSLQTTDFDSAVEALDALVNDQKGYYENSEYNYGSYYSASERQGYFTIRVPKQNYSAFLSAVGDVAHVVSRTTGTEDVGQAYYDAELHLSTLKTKHERLLVLLDKAELMEDIIALESALSDVEYQIQQYTSTLTRYDGLIDFATIHLNLREVIRVNESVTEKDPLGARMGAAFAQGWQNLCDSMADFAVWAAYNFIGVLISLVVLAVVIVIIVRAFRKVRRSRRARFQPVSQSIPQPTPQSGDEKKQ